MPAEIRPGGAGTRWTVSPLIAVTVTLTLAIVAGLAILVLHAVTGGTLPVAGHGRHKAAPARRATSSLPARTGPRAAPLRLVAGAGWVNGIYVRYPRSRAGAVSAAVEFVTELGSTLDPDRAATVARLTADPSYRAAAQDAAASVTAARRALGLPLTGPVPPGTSEFLVPVMYQLRTVTARQLTVLLLYDYTLTAAAGLAERVGVTAVRLTWTSAGWRLLTPPADQLAALATTPGTADAAAKGWKAMDNGL